MRVARRAEREARAAVRQLDERGASTCPPEGRADNELTQRIVKKLAQRTTGKSLNSSTYILHIHNTLLRCVPTKILAPTIHAHQNPSTHDTCPHPFRCLPTNLHIDMCPHSIRAHMDMFKRHVPTFSCAHSGHSPLKNSHVCTSRQKCGHSSLKMC